jgi:hypothetical protein
MPPRKLVLTVLGSFLGAVLWALLLFTYWLASGDDPGKAIFAG